MKNLIVILGAPNDEHGNLLPIAKSRADEAVEKYRKNPDSKVLITGGYGAHFNTTNRPHAYYVAQYLEKNGVSKEAILPFAESSNTVDDAIKVKEAISQISAHSITVITSDFHVERARLIFNQILGGKQLQFIGTETDLPIDQLNLLKQHEHKSIEQIRLQGGVMINQ